MRNVTVRRPDGVEMTIQVEDDKDIPPGYELVKAKVVANKAASPRNKKA